MAAEACQTHGLVWARKRSRDTHFSSRMEYFCKMSLIYIACKLSEILDKRKDHKGNWQRTKPVFILKHRDVSENYYVFKCGKGDCNTHFM